MCMVGYLQWCSLSSVPLSNFWHKLACKVNFLGLAQQFAARALQASVVLHA